MAETVFEELKRYVRFGGGGRAGARARCTRSRRRASSAIARGLLRPDPLARGGARASLVGGESQVGHLKVTLVRVDGHAAHRPVGRGVLRAPLPHRPGPRPHRAAAALHVRRDERDPDRARARSPGSASTRTPDELAARADRPRQDPRPRARDHAPHLPRRPPRPAGARRSGSPPSASSSARSGTTCATRSASSRPRSTSCAAASARTSARRSTSTGSASSSGSRTGSSRTCST